MTSRNKQEVIEESAEPTRGFQVLVENLERLHRLLSQSASQLVMQLSEIVVMHWQRVIEGLETVQPRLVPSGYLPGAFHFGMEPDPSSRLDSCGIEGGAGAFDAAFSKRLEALRQDLKEYFGQPGYRSSSDRCDQMMVTLARLSRFLGTWTFEVEEQNKRRWRGKSKVQLDGGVNLYGTGGVAGDLGKVRFALCFWEPLLHQALSAWDGNGLEAYDHALRSLRQALERSETERRKELPPPGYPLRSLKRPRQKVVVQSPEIRPLRSRTAFWMRYSQIVERMEKGLDLPDARLLALAEDVEHFIGMVESNIFMLVFEQGFQKQGRPGVAMIRGRIAEHPYLADAQGFFKKAVLFQNNTYTVAGGGLDRVFLELKQLERLLKFDNWNGLAKAKPLLETCFIAWEENRWRGFTEALMMLATYLRDSTD
ncbi:MAG: hypothetical protein OEW39_01310 [Deltaproteobacteria bacterium]|nr:hypothetical protein [Deltaproteobacteria bacterium]